MEGSCAVVCQVKKSLAEETTGLVDYAFHSKFWNILKGFETFRKVLNSFEQVSKSLEIFDIWHVPKY